MAEQILLNYKSISSSLFLKKKEELGLEETCHGYFLLCATPRRESRHFTTVHVRGVESGRRQSRFIHDQAREDAALHLVDLLHAAACAHAAHLAGSADCALASDSLVMLLVPVA